MVRGEVKKALTRFARNRQSADDTIWVIFLQPISRSMSIITEFTIPAEAFALQQTFEAIPDLTIEIERLATHSREWVMPFLWATNDNIDEVRNALQNDPSIDELKQIDSNSTNIGQFNVEWTEDFQQLIDQIVDQHGIMQEAEATNGIWYLKLKFVDQNAVNEFQTYFHERGYDFKLQRLYDGTAPKEREYDLTPEQHEVLVTALEQGYFSVPRKAQISDLADELGVSTNAISQRLRRATRNLTKNTLTVSVPDNLNER